MRGEEGTGGEREEARGEEGKGGEEREEREGEVDGRGERRSTNNDNQIKKFECHFFSLPSTILCSMMPAWAP